jgi:2-methylisocitrate lyase-like PEP mutase family enzyme
MSGGRRLRARLNAGGLMLLPGAPNALTARIIEDAGFEAVYVTGAGIANTFLGVPDIGLLTLTQLADHVAAMSDAVSIPLIVDADTGFGNALNVGHTVRVLERAGAAAIQLEDQTYPKRCGHFDGKDVIPVEEMLQKVRAAVDARSSDDLLIVARTDARATLGLSAAIDRVNAYAEAGADIVFLEAPQTVEEIERIAREVTAPQIVNNVRGGKTPELSRERLDELGFAITLYANLPLLAAVAAVQAALADLVDQSERKGEARQALATWTERQRLVRKDLFDELEQRYATSGRGQE